MAGLRYLGVLVILLCGATGLRASLSTRDHDMVVAAQTLLGTEVPSWRLEIRNARRSDAYPATTHALVFAWRDGLWFYCPTDGTQSLSRFRGRVERDRADLLPLLQRIDPGFASYRELPQDEGPEARKVSPDNACFLESLAFSRNLPATEPRVLRAEIVSYYTVLRGRRYGHSVVWYRTIDGDFVYDAAESSRGRRIKIGASASALEFARAVMPASRPGELVRAVALPVELEPRSDTMVAQSTAGSELATAPRT